MWNKIKDFGPERIAGFIYRNILTPPFYGKKVLYFLFVVLGTAVLGSLQHYCVVRFEISDDNLNALYTTSTTISITLFAVLVVIKTIRKEEWNAIADTLIYLFLSIMSVFLLIILGSVIAKLSLTLATSFFVITSTAYGLYLSVRFAQRQAETTIK